MKSRHSWKDRETLREEWLILDVERLVKSGRLDEAVASLQEADLEGDADARRWLRLAFLARGPEQQVERLNEALQRHPQNADIRRARARFFENQGNTRAAAFEHSLAVGLNPTPTQVEDAALFFLRNGAAETALAVWEDAPTTDLTSQAHARFWGRLIRPHRRTDSQLPATNTLAGAFARIDEAAFWDSRLDDFLEAESTLASLREDARMLRILESLRTRSLNRIPQLIDGNPNGPLGNVTGLRELLTCLARMKRMLDAAPGAGLIATNFAALPVASHPLFGEWNRGVAKWKERTAEGSATGGLREALLFCFPASVQRLLSSDHIWSAALLAAGFREAGLRLCSAPDAGAGYPIWFLVDYGRALSANRSAVEAFEFVNALPRHPALVPLTGELLYALGRPAEARGVLRRVATDESPVGFQAARLLAADLLRSGDAEAAMEVLDGNCPLKDSESGAELRMQSLIALERQHEAQKQAEAIAAYSESARQYLILRSLADGEFETAKSHARALVQARPDRPDYREALQGILRSALGPGSL